MKFLTSRLKTNFIKKRFFLDYLVYFGIIALLFAYFSSSRFFGTGADYNGYLAIFYGDEPTEPAFRLLKVINSFVNSGTVTLTFVYFVCTLFGLYLKGMLFKRYSTSFVISILLYLPTIYFLHEYTQIRASIGLGICFLAVDEIRNRNFKKFSARILIAMCFHYSSVIMFPVYFYCNFFKKQKRYLQILWISFFFCIFFNKVFGGRTLIEVLGGNIFAKMFFARKLGPSSINGFSIFNVGYLMILLINTAYYFVYHGFSEKKVEFTIFQLSSLSSIMFYMLYNFGFSVVAFRFSEFFIPFLFIVIPNIVKKFKEKFLLMPFVLFVVAYFVKTYLKAVFA